MSVFVSHPTGNTFVRALIYSLYQKKLLSGFATTISVNDKAKWLPLLPQTISDELLRRSYQLPKALVHTYPMREAARFVLPKIGFKNAVAGESGWASVDAVYKHLDARVAKYLSENTDSETDTIYAYEDGALASFEAAKKRAIKRVYDLPIAYWATLRKLLMEEAERLPAWATTLGGGIQDSEQKLERKVKELELADVVIGPGKFVLDSLPDWAKSKKIVMAPFGTPVDSHITVGPGTSSKTNGTVKPLRVLFAGSMGQRKGLGDLFEAIKILNTPQVELVVVGSLLDDLSFYKNQLPQFTYEPVRPHHKVLELMRSCDVFCLPSIVEGRALVMQEAMSQGLPIIITPNTGGEDLVIEGQTGFLVPIRCPEKIAGRIHWFLENRSQLATMGEAAMKHAATYTWDAYARQIISGIL